MISLWDAVNVYGNPIEGELLTTGTPLGNPPLIDMISKDPVLRGVKVCGVANSVCFEKFHVEQVTYRLLETKIKAHIRFLHATDLFYISTYVQGSPCFISILLLPYYFLDFTFLSSFIIIKAVFLIHFLIVTIKSHERERERE